MKNKDKNEPLSEEQKQAITKLFFKRVKSASRRQKIIRLAMYLSDNGSEPEELYAAMYTYSLRENWQEADDDYTEFGLEAYAPDNDYVRSSLDLPPLPARKTRPLRKKPAQRKRRRK